MTLKYQCNLELTEEQKEEDHDYGIFEGESRLLTFDTNKKTFTFDYDHYYESEVNYVLKTANKNILKMEGTYEKQDNKYIANITNGNQKFEVLIH